MRYAVAALVIVSMCSVGALEAQAGETETVGGSGGERTVRMDCGASGFITGLYARGGRRIGYDHDLVRDLAVICTSFDETERSAYPPSVRADYAHSQDGQNTVQCPQGHAIYGLSVKAGLYIDQMEEAWCRPTASPLSIAVGGDGGTGDHLACPKGQALYRLDARTGVAIDSLKGYCRVFPPPNTQSVALAAHINASLAPKPPMGLPASGTVRQIQFTVPSTGLYRNVLFQVIASAGGYRVEFVDPTGAIAKSVTAAGPVAGISIHFGKAGTWLLKLRSVSPAASVGIQSILVAGE